MGRVSLRRVTARALAAVLAVAGLPVLLLADAVVHAGPAGATGVAPVLQVAPVVSAGPGITPFVTERTGTFSYAVPIANGDYQVTLWLGDGSVSGVGQRVFDVTAEGSTVVQGLDPVALVGASTPLKVMFTSSVADGVLNLGFTPTTGVAQLSGLEISPLAGGTVTLIDVGSAVSVTDDSGRVWAADSGATGGSTATWGPPPTAFDREQASVSTGQWANAPTSFTYAWQRCDIGGGNCVAIAGATASSYSYTSGDVGFSVRAKVTATNVTGSTDSYSASTPEITGVFVPSPLGLPSVSGPLAVGSTLTAGSGSWSWATRGFTYAWQRCDANGANCAAISGATSKTYVAVSADSGKTLRVQVSASNLAGAATAQTSPASGVLGAGTGAPVGTGAPMVTQLTDLTPYSTVRYGTPFSYAIPVTNGAYRVRLLFVEDYFNTPGSRVFSVTAEGAPAISALDQVAESGGYEQSLERWIPVTVADGALNLVFSALVDNAEVAGIQVWPASGSGLPVASIDVGAATGFTDAAGVVWSADQYFTGGTTTFTGNAATLNGATLVASLGTWTGSPTSYSLQWQRCDLTGGNCAAITLQTGRVYVATAADVSSTLRAAVTATNATGSAAASSPATATITKVWTIPAAPVSTSAPQVTGATTLPSTVRAGLGGWVNSPRVYSYTWQRCDSAGANCATISGATSATYVLAAADVTKTLRVTVTAANTSGVATAAQSAASAVIANPAVPTVAINPETNGTARQSSVQTAYTGVWTGVPSSYAYAWKRCDSAGANCTTISGATSSTYTLASADVSKTIRVRVTATNAGGASSPVDSTQTAVVTNTSSPNPTTLPSITGTTNVGSTLTANKGTWTGSPTYAYQWLRCNLAGNACVTISGATSSTYVLTTSDKATTIRVRVTGTNASGATVTRSAATAMILTSGAPKNTALPTISANTPAALYQTAVDFGSFSYAIPVGGAGVYQVRLALSEEEVNAAGSRVFDVAAEGATVLSGVDVFAESGWYGIDDKTFAVTVNDGVLNLDFKASIGQAWVNGIEITGITNGGFTPVRIDSGSTVDTVDANGNTWVADATFGGGFGTSGNPTDPDAVLSVSTGTWSPAATSYAYQWQRCDTAGVNCAAIAGATAATYKPVAADNGTTLRVGVTATNASGNTLATTAQTATLALAWTGPLGAPSVTGFAMNGQSLAAVAGVWSNAPAAFTYAWERCNNVGGSCVAISGATAQTYTLTIADVASTVRAKTTATNAGGATSTWSPVTAVVAASSSVPIPTTAPSAALVPGAGVYNVSRDGDLDYAIPLTNATYRVRLLFEENYDNGVGQRLVNVDAEGQPMLRAVDVYADAGGIGITVDKFFTVTVADGTLNLTFRTTVNQAEVRGIEITNTVTGAVAKRIAAGNTSSVIDSVGLTWESDTAYTSSGVSYTWSSPTGALNPTVGTTTGTWSNTPTSYTYGWQRCDLLGANCAAISGATAQTYTVTTADLGSTLRSVVTATNVSGSTPATGAPIAVGTTPSLLPVNTAPPVIGGSTIRGNTLLASTGAWAGHPALYSYAWQRCDTSGNNCAAITGATQSTYITAAGDVGSTIRVAVAATNNNTTTVATSAQTATIAAAVAPTNTSTPTITGDPRVGGVLTGTRGLWSNGPLSWSYSWMRCDSAGANCGDIAGANVITYTVATADETKTLRFKVFATNAAGQTLANSTQTAVVPTPAAPGAPTVVTAAAIPGGATVTWQTPAADGGAPIVSYTITPYIGGTAQNPITVAAVPTTANVTGLTSGTAYTFQVKASNGVVVGTAGTTAGSTTAAPASTPPVPGPESLSVMVSYADTYHGPYTLIPAPWQGSPGVTFAGSSTGQWDTSGIKLDNPTSGSVTVDSVTVDIGPNHYALWPANQVIAAGQSLILAGYGLDTFDGSDTGTCTGSGYQPVVHVTVGTVTRDFIDTNQILNSGGYEAGNCFSLNEGQDWVPIGSAPSQTETRGCGPLAADQWIGLKNQGVDLVSGRFCDTATDVSINARGMPLEFSRTYSSARATTDGPLGFGWTASVFAQLTRQAAIAANSITVREENGAEVTFGPDGKGGWRTATRDFATLTTNVDGSYTYRRLNADTLTFDKSGRLTARADLNGETTTFSYNASGQLSSMADNTGRALTFAWTTDGHVQTITDPLTPTARTVTFGYTNGELTDVTDVNGGNTHYGYLSGHLLNTVRDPRVNTTTIHYDSYNRVDWVQDPLTHQTSYAYTAQKTTITDPRTFVTEITFTNAQPTTIKRGLGTSVEADWTLAYDPVTLGVTSVTDPNNHIASKIYDARGNVTSETDGANHTTTRTFNAFNEPLTVTDANNHTTTYTYDPLGNLLTESRPYTEGSTTRVMTYHHDDATHPGDVTSTTDPVGKVWTKTYWPTGDLKSDSDPLANLTTYAYNSIGWLTSKVMPEGNAAGGNPAQWTWTYDYTSFGEKKTETNPVGEITRYEFDANRNLTKVTDPATNVTQYTYDAANRRTVTTRPDTLTLVDGYDNADNLTSHTDANTHAVNYGYDALNRRTTVTDALNRVTTTAYDGAGNVHTITDPSNRVTTMGYDGANRLTSIAYSDGLTPNVTYGYDPVNNRTSMIDGTGTSSYSYDSLDRLTSTTNGAGTTLGYGWDLAGRQTKITYPGGRGDVTSVLDDAGRVTTITDWASRQWGFGYNHNGDLTTQTNPNGTDETSTVDHADRIIDVKHKITATGVVFGEYNYTRNTTGRIGTVTVTGTGIGANHTYGYTNLNQLYTIDSATIGYDSMYNTTAYADGSTAAYDVTDQLCWKAPTGTGTCAAPPANATTYGYDVQGDRTTKTVSSTTTTYGYDQALRLTTITGGTTYTYNGDGLRTTKTVASTTTQQTWDTSSKLPMLVLDGTDAYVNGPEGLPLAKVNGTTPTYLHHDQQGSTRQTTDATATITGTWDYDPSGAVTAHTGTGTTALGYDGQYTDPETNNIYLRARYYDATTHVFLTKDPVVGGSANNYDYVFADPLDRSDLSGLCWICDVWDDTGGKVVSGTNDHVVKPVVGGAKSVSHVVARVAPKLWKGTIDVVALPVYGVYYGARRAAHFNNSLAKRVPGPFGWPARAAAHLSNIPFVALQASGLAGDALLDLAKGERINDEGRRGCTQPLHSYIGPCGPTVFLPGVNPGDWSVDIAF